MLRFFIISFLLNPIIHFYSITDQNTNEKIKLYNKKNCSLKNKADTILATGLYFISDTPTNFKRHLYKSDTSIFITPEPIISIKNYKRFEITKGNFGDKKYSILVIYLDEMGERIFFHVTESHIKERLAIVINNQLIANPIILSSVANGVFSINRDDLSFSELKFFKNELQKEFIYFKNGFD